MDTPSLLSHCKHWLVFRLGHMGDVALTTGALAKLHERYKWSFAFVTRERWAELLTGNQHVESVIPLADTDLGTLSFMAVCAQLAACHRGWGLLDLHGNLRSHLLSLFWRGPVLRYPKMSMERRLFLRTRGREGGERLRQSSVPQRYYMAAASPPPPSHELVPRIRLSSEETALARQKLDTLLGKGVKPLALHPFAAHPLKTWPREQWQAFVELLDAKGIPWTIIGRGKQLFPKRKQDLSNTNSLRESCALLACSRALLSGDSGPMHLASAVGTPVVALFGPTTREWGFYPCGPNDLTLEKELPCRPCSLHGRAPCPRNGECLTGIQPESVLAALEAQGILL